ncbi:hypothetical protein F5Y19DRAFT_475907 [Xylariaceae sp. FL1651]|nr:hypothetical protein F5Y19DRAFT_475907 [Xylariaceae sp. FL1651]
MEWDTSSHSMARTLALIPHGPCVSRLWEKITNVLELGIACLGLLLIIEWYCSYLLHVISREPQGFPYSPLHHLNTLLEPKA